MRPVCFVLFFSVVVLAGHPLRAQTHAADSLKVSLTSVADTQRVHNCIRISYLNTHLNVDTSLVYAERALDLAYTIHNRRLVALAKAQLGIHYTSASQFDKGVEYGIEAFKTFDTLNDYANASYAANIIGNASIGADNKKQALDWYRSSRDYGARANNEYKVAVALFGMANVEFELKIFDSAFVHFNTCEAIFLKLGKKREAVASGLTAANIDFRLGRYQQSYDHLMEIRKDVLSLNDKYILAYWYYQRGCTERELNRHVPALADLQTALLLFREIKSFGNVKDCYDELAKTHYSAGNADSAYHYSKLFIRLNDSLYTTEKDTKIAQIEEQFQSAEKDKKLLQNQVDINNHLATLKEQESRQLIFIIALVVMILVTGIAYWSYRRKQRDNVMIAREMKKSEELLLNILPHETAMELKQSGFARARNFDMVTVMFTDFKGFTAISEKLTADELVAEINEYFVAFDHIIHKHGIEKIKTIGDAYMAVGGLPTPRATHAVDVVNAALEILEFVRLKKIEKGLNGFEVRIGIHSGPVIAGIVGIKKFAYDIWGDTVNIASRMESAGVNGAINASASTYALVKDKFRCIPRGRIDAKGKGELEMYFIVPDQTERVMDFVRAKEYIIDQLKTGLPVEYYYHSLNHTLDVLKSVNFLIQEEQITNAEEIEILRTAAVYHDAGFLRRYEQNEIEASKMAAEMLPGFGYSENQVSIIRRCIMVTELSAVPTDHLERIMKDADFDYLGREDYWDFSILLRKEWESVGIYKTDQEWFALQVAFLSGHEYYTDTARRLRAPMKLAHIVVLEKLLKEATEKSK